MSELLGEITKEAKEFLDGDRSDVQRSVYRAIKQDKSGASIHIEQSKLISPEDISLVRAKGAAALATTEWFNDVDWLTDLNRKDIGWRDLSLAATYPPGYFDEEPRGGLFIEDEDGTKWHEQYGSMSGSGSGLFVLRFVMPGEKAVTQLYYPDNPNALNVYNDRFRLYMDELDEAEPTITYYRGWDYVFSRDRESTPRMLGGISLAGIGLSEVLHQGTSGIDDAADTTRIVLHVQSKSKQKIHTRDVVINEGEAVTNLYTTKKDRQDIANEELLTTTLELIRGVNRTE